MHSEKDSCILLISTGTKVHEKPIVQQPLEDKGDEEDEHDEDDEEPFNEKM